MKTFSLWLLSSVSGKRSKEACKQEKTELLL